MTEEIPLVEECEFYAQHLSDWLREHAGKFVLVKNRNLIGFYDTADTAIEEGVRQFGLTSFLVRQVAATQPVVRLPALMFGVLSGDSVRSIP